MNISDACPIYSNALNDRRVSVVIPLYNYEGMIEDTLDSVTSQSFRDVAIIVIDDQSTDQSVDRAHKWMLRNRDCGMGLGLWKNKLNAKLSATRNTGIVLSDSEYCFFLDADNLLYPRCLEKHIEVLDQRENVAAAYSLIEVFGARADIIDAGVFDRQALMHGNFIDAMAMVRRSTLLDLGGYAPIPYGWEDYDLWLRMVEEGQLAIHIPEILSRYREHSSSMLRTQTNLPDHIRRLHADMTRRHPWLDLH